MTSPMSVWTSRRTLALAGITRPVCWIGSRRFAATGTSKLNLLELARVIYDFAEHRTDLITPHALHSTGSSPETLKKGWRQQRSTLKICSLIRRIGNALARTLSTSYRAAEIQSQNLWDRERVGGANRMSMLTLQPSSWNSKPWRLRQSPALCPASNPSAQHCRQSHPA